MDSESLYLISQTTLYPYISRAMQVADMEIIFAAWEDMERLESDNRPKANWLIHHPEINAQMRMILVAWICDVGF